MRDGKVERLSAPFRIVTHENFATERGAEFCVDGDAECTGWFRRDYVRGGREFARVQAGACTQLARREDRGAGDDDLVSGECRWDVV